MSGAVVAREQAEPMIAAETSEDLARADFEQYLCEPFGVAFEDLAGFPAASYVAGKKASPRWAPADVVPYLTGLFRGLAPHARPFPSLLRIEAALRPYASDQERRERALERFVQVAVARVLMRRLP